MPSCVIKRCYNNSRNANKIKGVTFHRFASNKISKNEWMQIIRESRNELEWDPKTWSVICSKHFEASDLYTTKSGLFRIVPYTVPKKFLHETSADTYSTASTSRVPSVESSKGSLNSITPLPGVDMEQLLSVLYSSKKRRMKEQLMKMDALILSHKKN